MSLWLRSTGDGTITLCTTNSLATAVAVVLDDPWVLTRSVVYSADLAEIWGEVSSLEDATTLVRKHIAGVAA